MVEPMLLEGSVTISPIELSDRDESQGFEHDLPKPPSIIGADNIAVSIRRVERSTVLIGVSVGRVRMSFLEDDEN
jgi:hypothetical protein